MRIAFSVEDRVYWTWWSASVEGWGWFTFEAVVLVSAMKETYKVVQENSTASTETRGWSI